MRFSTVINCMDGRVQLPAIQYLMKRFDTPWVDSITEAGPNRILAERKQQDLVQSIIERLEISVIRHNSKGVAVVGHHDCAANPAAEDEQLIQTDRAVAFLRREYGHLPIIGLWVDEEWQVHEVVTDDRVSLCHGAA